MALAFLRRRSSPLRSAIKRLTREPCRPHRQRRPGGQGRRFIDLLLIVGIVCAILFVDKAGSIRLQILGFVGCAAGLAIAASSTYVTGGNQLLLIFAGFMLFNFMTNLGPNAQTYLLAGEVFPTRVRGMAQASPQPLQRSALSRRLFCSQFCWSISVPKRFFTSSSDVAAWRHYHLAVPHRYHRREPGADWELTRRRDAGAWAQTRLGFLWKRRARSVRRTRRK